ncbi:MAG: diguanylate cyclase [Gammaproteobacteria bacterium]|nr:diguanylate cyclase [Gammaproteobacteria bacterium]
MSEIQSVENAIVVATRIADILASFDVDGLEVSLTASIGISLYPRDGEELRALLKQANAAMRYAKTHGRNCFHFYTDSLYVQA